jgi:F-box/WD-40 domain protein 7
MEGQARWRELVGKIRFPLMEEGYLRTRVVAMAPAEEAEWMARVVAEALRSKAAQWGGDRFEFELLGPKARDHRMGLGVKWENYAYGGEQRMGGDGETVFAAAECEGRICTGSTDGSILVWNIAGKAAQGPERRLVREGARCSVFSLAACEGRLISGYGDGQLRVWNVVAGTCEQVLAERRSVAVSVCAMAVCGSRLACNTGNRSIRVWAIGAAGRWTVDKMLRGHTDAVRAMVECHDRLVSGSDDTTVRVWEVGTGAREATLTGHARSVYGLAVHGDRLFSGSDDGTIRVWEVGRWAALQTVEASGGYLRCLAVSGSKLVSGSRGQWGQVRVWDLKSLDLQHTLPQPGGANVFALVAVQGAVWAGVGDEVVVWGNGT